MIYKSISRFVPIILVVLMLLGTVSAFAANIVVPTTHLIDQAQAITANALKPASCSGITLARFEICTGGHCNGTNANDLILGTSGFDDIHGKKGNDCILGGDGNDQITGDQGEDVCIGGPGADTLDNVECETRNP